MPIANTCSIGYPHDCLADNATYRQDRRADKRHYRQDNRADSLSPSGQLSGRFPFRMRDSDPSETLFGTQRAGTQDSTNTANRRPIHKFVHS